MAAVSETGSACPRWLPNAISGLRILLVPVWAASAESCRSAALEGDDEATATLRLVTIVILLTIGVSDLIDGFLARRFDLTSRTGATLDAFADKLAQVALLLFFTLRGAPAFPQMPVWFLILLLARDLLLAVGWLVLRHRHGYVLVAHRIHGKVASALLFALLILLSAGIGGSWIDGLTWTIALIVTLSTAAYARDGAVQLRYGPITG